MSTSTRPRCRSKRQAVGEEAWRAACCLADSRDRRSGRLPLVQAPRPAGGRSRWSRPARPTSFVVAYFDRLVRSLKVQLEVIERVERAGGEIFALDHGKLTNGTAAQRLSTNMLGSVFQYFAEITGEKVTAAQARAVARGVLPHPRIPCPGMCAARTACWWWSPRRRRSWCEAFQRRDLGASLVEMQAFLAENGIERALSGVAWMLRSRMYLGEIHFGELHNTRAHEAIVKDRALFERVQRRTVSRGRQAKSERLLARLGVLRCGTCGSRMVINSDSGSYRCGDTSANRASDERRSRPTASRRWCWTRSGRTRPRPTRTDAASRRRQIREADEAIERANAGLDDTIRQLGGLGLLGRPASQETLEKLAKTLDDAHAARARLGDGGESNIIGPDEIDKLPRTREALSGLATADHRHRRVGHGRAGDDGGWAPQSPLGPSPDRHQVPGPASVRKPPAATSRAFRRHPRVVRLAPPLPDRRAVGHRRRARLPQPREAAKRDRRHRRGEIRPQQQRGRRRRCLLSQGWR